MAETPAAAGSSTTTPAPAPPSKPPRRSFRSFFWGSLIGALILIGLYTMFMLWWSYSEGERAGVLQKFSKRGWICKTYEGEVAQYIVGGVAPQIWNFSVRDPLVAEQLHKTVGQQVRHPLQGAPRLAHHVLRRDRLFRRSLRGHQRAGAGQAVVRAECRTCGGTRAGAACRATACAALTVSCWDDG